MAGNPCYICTVVQVLFMESGEHYYNKDGWPPEVDRPVMIRLAAEIPVAEVKFKTTILRMIG